MLETDTSPAVTSQIAASSSATRDRDAVAAFREAILSKLTYMVAKEASHAREHDWFMATALAVRDRIIDRWSETTRKAYRDGRKRVYYFSRCPTSVWSTPRARPSPSSA